LKSWLDKSKIESQLQELGYTLQKPKAVAEAVLRLSDFYIKNPTVATPWSEKWAQVAYFAYFHPLNCERIARVVEQGKNENFFSGFENVIDFGSGLGAGSLPLLEQFPLKASFIESSSKARELHQGYFRDSETKWLADDRNIKVPAKTLAVFSYSLTELAVLPRWAEQCEGLMIVEPSTSDDGRKLLQLRQHLIEKKWFAWAPCRHQLSCPLILHSKRDWCHDRVRFQKPDWFQKLEAELPIKNNTLTMSYLLLRKSPPVFDPLWNARLTGDMLEEKGKNRMLVCRNSDREFLAWLHRNGDVPDLQRGDLFSIDPAHTKKSDELRMP
jgi:hypothetical protein